LRVGRLEVGLIIFGIAVVLITDAVSAGGDYFKPTDTARRWAGILILLTLFVCRIFPAILLKLGAIDGLPELTREERRVVSEDSPPPLYTNAGRRAETWRDQPGEIDVTLSVYDPLPVGTAICLGPDARGLAVWRLVVSGSELPGTWLVENGQFVPATA
jgi:hypothetical protein